jgi:hypothetical protein
MFLVNVMFNAGIEIWGPYVYLSGPARSTGVVHVAQQG